MACPCKIRVKSAGHEEEEDDGERVHSYRDAVVTKWNWIGLFIFLLYCGTALYYFIIRATKTLDMGIEWSVLWMWALNGQYIGSSGH
jgi:hypothetical protein